MTGTELQRLRTKKGLTQKQLGEILHYRTEHICRLEKRFDRQLPRNVLMRIEVYWEELAIAAS